MQKYDKHDMQITGFLSEENKFDQISSNFLKLPFFLWKFFDEDDIAKLVVDIWRNCSNRLCQSTSPTLMKKFTDVSPILSNV